MAFRPVTKEDSNARSVANFQELFIYFNVAYEVATEFLDAGMSFEDIKEYARTQNGFGKYSLQ